MARSRSSFFSFPDPVNDYAARTVAALVVAESIAFLATRQSWLLGILAYGFWARILSGPRLSPAGLLATHLAAPRLASALGPARLVPGPPKRFAQGIGVAFSTTALLLSFAAGETTASLAVVAVLAAAAFLEAALGYCLGCKIFALLMRVGLIPESVCADCSDLSGRLSPASSNP